MPSLILTGNACTGKTTFANLLAERAKNHKSNIITKTIIINNQSSRPDKTTHECYQSSTEEKLTRSALKSEFDKYVIGDKSTLVILDCLNYIKGFRYELHCISKAVGEKHGVIWLLCDEAVAKQWNKERIANNEKDNGKDKDKDEPYYYTEKMMDELMLRYEPPDQRNRWDKPLYRVDVNSTLPDSILQGYDDNNDNDNDDETGRTAETILNKSVYNMHSLSDAIKDTSQSKTVTSNQKKIIPSEKEREREMMMNGDSDNSDSSDGEKEEVEEKKDLTLASLSSLAVKTTRTVTSTTNPSQKKGSSFRRAKPGNGFRRAGVKKQNTTPTTITTIKQETPTLVPANIKQNEPASTTTTKQQKQKRTVKKMEDIIDNILDSFLLNVQPLKEGQSTKIEFNASTNVLNDVESISQKLATALLEAQSQSVNGTGSGTLTIPIGTTGKQASINVHKTIRVVEMKRLRRQYVSWVKDHPPKDASMSSIAFSFLSFIENQL